MAWLDGYRKRMACTVRDATGGVLEARLTLPKFFDDFWDTIDTDGYGIRVTLSDGVTEVGDYFYSTAFNKTTRAGVLDAKTFAVPAASIPIVFFVYYDPVATATDGSSSYSPSSPVTATVALQVPPGTPLAAVPAPPGATAPDQAIAKTPDEVFTVWWDITDIFETPLLGQTFGVDRYEEVLLFQWTVEQAKSAVTSMYDTALTYIIEAEGRMYAGGIIKAGTTANNYTGQLSVTTCLPGAPATPYRTLNFRALVQVYDVDET